MLQFSNTEFDPDEIEKIVFFLEKYSGFSNMF